MLIHVSSALWSKLDDNSMKFTRYKETMYRKSETSYILPCPIDPLWSIGEISRMFTSAPQSAPSEPASSLGRWWVEAKFGHDEPGENMIVFVDIFFNVFLDSNLINKSGMCNPTANIQWGFTCGDFCSFPLLETIQSMWWDCYRIMECYRMTEWWDHDLWKDMMRSISWDLLKLHRSKRDSLKPAVICQCPEATRAYKHRQT